MSLDTSLFVNDLSDQNSPLVPFLLVKLLLGISRLEGSNSLEFAAPPTGFFP